MTVHPYIQIEPVFHVVGDDAADNKSSTATPAYLSVAQFCRQIDALPEPSIVRLQGACDPLLHLHFCEMVRYATARGHQVSTHTCLTVLPEYLANECMECGLHTITIALDAADSQNYRAIHGKARFDKILRNLRRLMAARAKHGTGLPEVRLVCTVTKKNLAQLVNIIDFAYQEGIASVYVQHNSKTFSSASEARFPALYSYADEDDLTLLDPLRVAFHFNRARLRAQKLHIELHLPKLPRLSSAWHWLHKTTHTPHFLRYRHQPVTATAINAAVATTLDAGKNLAAPALAAISENTSLHSCLPNRGNATATEVGQASLARSGTY